MGVGILQKDLLGELLLRGPNPYILKVGYVKFTFSVVLLHEAGRCN